MSTTESGAWRLRRPEGNLLLRRLLMVAFFLEVGVLLVFVPWSAYWESNYFVSTLPWVRPVVGNHFVRGAVSGLGLLNLLAGLSELVPVFERRE